jgi:ribosomal protein L29
MTNEELAEAVNDLRKEFNELSVQVERTERGSHYSTHRMRSADVIA